MPDSTDTRLGRLEAKIDAILDTQKEHGTIIETLQEARYRVLGASATIGMLIGGLVWFIERVV